MALMRGPKERVCCPRVQDEADEEVVPKALGKVA
jgi:hypothetical protein